jgi:RimJ/RimL family protein N-acetyltransferase
VFRGAQVVIRPIEADDQAFIIQLNADPIVRANVVGWGFPQSLHEQQRWFDGQNESNTHRWLVTDPDGDRIGLTGLWQVNWHDRNAEVGIKLGGPANVRGRGLGSDTLKAVMAFAFYEVGLHRLSAPILSSNTASIKLFVNHAGFQHEGVARQQVWRHGRYVDLLHLGALRKDFDALPDAAEYVARITTSSEGLNQ